jgi:hypothetical protein
VQRPGGAVLVPGLEGRNRAVWGTVRGRCGGAAGGGDGWRDRSVMEAPGGWALPDTSARGSDGRAVRLPRAGPRGGHRRRRGDDEPGDAAADPGGAGVRLRGWARRRGLAVESVGDRAAWGRRLATVEASRLWFRETVEAFAPDESPGARPSATRDRAAAATVAAWTRSGSAQGADEPMRDGALGAAPSCEVGAHDVDTGNAARRPGNGVVHARSARRGPRSSSRHTRWSIVNVARSRGARLGSASS